MSPLNGSSCDRRNDADRVSRLHRRVLFLEIADVLVVQVDVDETPELALLVVEVRREPGVRRGEIDEQLANRRAVDFDSVLLSSERPKRSRNQNLVSH